MVYKRCCLFWMICVLFVLLQFDMSFLYSLEFVLMLFVSDVVAVVYMPHLAFKI